MSQSLSVVRTLTVVGVVILSVHCSSGGSGAIGDGGLQTRSDGSVTGCPNQPPAGGTACSLPSGTACNDYASPGCECCSPSTYTCQNGKWLVQAGGGPPSGFGGCPSQVPAQGSSCGSPCSGMAPPECSYTCAQAGVEATASCTGGTWQINMLRTACELDGGSDASDGGDASHDAASD